MLEERGRGERWEGGKKREGSAGGLGRARGKKRGGEEGCREGGREGGRKGREGREGGKGGRGGKEFTIDISQNESDLV